MEVWTFIHKNTNELIRCDILSNDVEFGNMKEADEPEVFTYEI